MGFYATTTSISDLLPNYLVGNTTTSDANGVALFSRHIDRAEGMVNAALNTKYDVSTFTTTALPPMLTQLSEDIACYFAIRGASTQDGQIKNEYVEKFKVAYDFVQDVLKGEATISLTYPNRTSVPTKASGRIKSSNDTYVPITNLDDPENWQVDPSLIDDIASERT